ncbi:MAG: cation transporter [Clostridia bacterium]|nr:cation transporter [Clostridia bacterium]
MTDFWVRKFIKNSGDTGNPAVRSRYTVLSGVLGIVYNGILFAVKLIIGIISASIAITSDAFNNLSDLGTSVVTLVSARLSGKQPDREHPFGHGRVEYVASLVMAMVIMVVGAEMLKSSVEGIIHPEPVKLSLPMIVILVLSIGIKIRLWAVNRKLGRAIGSTLLLAAAKDSLWDSLRTLAAIAGAVLAYIFGGSRYAGSFISKVPFDGIIGLVMSLFILWSGFCIARDVVNRILGGAPDPLLVSEIKKHVTSGKDILGIHDLIVHDYGPGRVFASAHAEVPYKGNMMELHETIDKIENDVQRELGVVLVVHMDPVVNDSPRVDALREMTERICVGVNGAFSIHDFRITDGEDWVNLIFDLVVPTEMSIAERKEAVKTVKEKLREEDRSLHAVINAESEF